MSKTDVLWIFAVISDFGSCKHGYYSNIHKEVNRKNTASPRTCISLASLEKQSFHILASKFYFSRLPYDLFYVALSQVLFALKWEFLWFCVSWVYRCNSREKILHDRHKTLSNWSKDPEATYKCVLETFVSYGIWNLLESVCTTVFFQTQNSKFWKKI